MFSAVLLLLIFVVWQLPASLIDSALNRYSDNKLRLAETQGSVWRGSGLVMVLDPVSDRWQPWTKIDWNADWGALLRFGVAWQLMVQDTPLARVELATSGVRIDELHLRGPARLFLQQMQNVIGRAGWRGDIAIDSAHWQCTWQYQCQGGADLRWFGAASDLLEGRVLGDYQVLFLGNGEHIDFQWDTLQGSVRTKGDGRWQGQGTPRLSGTISGDVMFLQSLPSVASRWVRVGSEPGVWLISIQ
ncbi:MAG: type II secretion system protein N [Rhodocyclaceae bacterium]|nr:type II secretion system protein N [Rhodocyclaceae bacterium]